jgi:tellurite methyltransferase
VIRTIAGFHADDAGEWVAELSCLHGQHVRHQPPFRQRQWVMTPAGRADRLGSEIDCPLCDRAELPEGLRLVRTAGPFDADTVPEALRKVHRIAAGTWGVLRLIEGSAGLRLATTPPIDRWLTRGATQPIPPLVSHHLTIDGAVVLAVDFLVADP